MIQASDLPADAVITDEREDQITLNGKRSLLSKTGRAGSAQEEAFMKIAKLGMDGDEASFSVESNISNQVISHSSDSSSVD